MRQPHPARGIIAPLATPLSGGKLDEESLVRLVQALAPDVDAFFVLGSSGQFPLLRASDARRVVQIVLDVLDGSRPVVVGIGDISTTRVLENLDELVDPRASGVLVCAPFYHQVQDTAALVRHFVTAAEASALPLVIYNIPSAVGYSLSPDVVLELSSHDAIIGVKDSSGDLFLHQQLLGLAGERFAVLQGREELVAISAFMGGDGVVSALGNLAPRLLRATYLAGASGDANSARAWQATTSRIARLFAERYWLSALMTALATRGLCSPEVLPPLSELDANEREHVRAYLGDPSVEPYLVGGGIEVRS